MDSSTLESVGGPLDDITPLDRASTVPLWSQLEIELRTRLDSGRFDEHFPTDFEITEAYGISRHTVREAIGPLSRDGLIHRVRGRGTAVVKRELEQNLGAVHSLFESIECHGDDQTSEVLNRGVVSDAAAAKQLGLARDAELFFVERIRSAGSEPLAVDRAWLPLNVARPLLDADLNQTSLYAQLESIGVACPNKGWDRIAPVAVDPDMADTLGLADGGLAFMVERLGTVDGVPLEWRTTVVRSDRFRFLNQWESGGVSAVSLAEAEQSIEV